jgi:hypothetical protein
MKHEHLDEFEIDDPSARAVDDALRQALRAEDPGAAFTQRVLARAREERAAQPSSRPMHAVGTAAFPNAKASAEVSAEAAPEVSAERVGAVTPAGSRSRTPRFTTTRKLIAAIAASLTFAAAGTQWLQHRRYVAEGERARAQVLAALRLTNEKLNIVHDKITERERAR